MSKKRYGKGKHVITTLEQQRALFPKKLIEAFVKLHDSGYAASEHEAYTKQAQAHLGKAWNETLERLKLIVLLTSATYDLVKKGKG
jgi:hypothetical protein